MDREVEGSSDAKQPNLEVLEADRISALPDSVLVRILSLLPFQDALSTSLLSRRWRRLYSYNPNLDFDFNAMDYDSKRFVCYVTTYLVNFPGDKIDRFRAFFAYFPLKHGFLLNSWLRFAGQHGVEEIDVDLTGGYKDAVFTEHENKHILPQRFYTECRHLTRLRLSLFNLSVPASVDFQFLKEVDLECIYLSAEECKSLTAGCPLLERLLLCRCNVKSDLFIYAPNTHLKHLYIHDWIDDIDEMHHDKTMVHIYAPHVEILSIEGSLRSCYAFDDISSLNSLYVSVSIPFKYLTEDNYDFHKRLANLLDVLSQFADKLTDLCVCRWCIEAFSVLAMHDHVIPSLKVTSLKLDMGYSTGELIGMSYLLKCCPSLDRLGVAELDKEDLLHGKDAFSHYGLARLQCWKDVLRDFFGPRELLKTVKSVGLTISDENSEEESTDETNYPKDPLRLFFLFCEAFESLWVDMNER